MPDERRVADTFLKRHRGQHIRSYASNITLRLYDAKNADTKTRLHVGLPLASAALCDMVETAYESLNEKKDGTVELSFRAFEIKTLRLALRASRRKQ